MTVLKNEKIQLASANFNGESSLPPITAKSLDALYKDYQLDEDDGLFINYGIVESLYPYRQQDMYDRELVPREYDAVILENDYLKATFLPAFGGKLWSLIDKKRDRELLFRNEVVRPCNLALRNAWLSGGVEWNSCVRGHHPHTCSLVNTAQTVLEDNTPVLRFYYFERVRCAVVQMDFFLPEDSRLLMARMRITNPNDGVIPMYWWSNIAAVEKEGNRVIVPAEESYTAFPDGKGGYSIRKINIPQFRGTDTSYPVNNRSSIDYFWKTLSDKRKYVCELDREGYGLCQTSTSRLKSRKMFVWGNSQGGHKWMNFLTADDQSGSYNEIQCGLAYTQYESLPMPPRTVWEWLEGYGAIEADKDKVHGNWQEAQMEVERCLDELITDRELEKMLAETRDMAKSPAQKKLFSMSGWGALELYRRSLAGQSLMNDHLDFGEMSEEQQDWKRLLDEGTVGEHSPSEIPVSYLRQKEWLALLEAALKDKDKDNWYAYFLYGTALIAENQYEKAQDYLDKSLKLENTAWANYAMAVNFGKLGDQEKENAYMLKAHDLRSDDVSLAKELFKCLFVQENSKLTVEIFECASEEIRRNNRCRLYYAYALARLGLISQAEKILYGDGCLVIPDIREGDLIVTDLWYYIQEKKGIARETVGMPPRDLDFRMYANFFEDQN